MQGRHSFRGAVSAINALQRQSIISLRSQSWPVVKNIYSELSPGGVRERTAETLGIKIIIAYK